MAATLVMTSCFHPSGTSCSIIYRAALLCTHVFFFTNLYAHANFWMHNCINRICPRGTWGGLLEINLILAFNLLCLGSAGRRELTCELTGGVVSDAVKHLWTGSWHHLAGAAPGPAGANAIDGGVTVDSRAWKVGTEMSNPDIRAFPAWLRTTYSHS